MNRCTIVRAGALSIIVACEDPAAEARLRREAERAVERALAEARAAADPTPPEPDPEWGAPIPRDMALPRWSRWGDTPLDPQPPVEVVQGLSVTPMFVERTPGMLAEAVRAASRISIARLSASGVAPSKACGAGTPLQVYQWPEAALPVERFMPSLQLPEDQNLRGVYVPRAAPPFDAIVVHDGREEDVREVLVHEFAHYWWAHACGGRTLTETSEDFAQAVQADFLREEEARDPTWDIPPREAPSPAPRHDAEGVPLDGVVVSADSVLLQVDGPVKLAPGSRVRVTVEEADGRRCRRRGLFRRWRCE